MNNKFYQALVLAYKKIERQLELEKDKQDLKDYGLTDEEIEGYEDMFIENYFLEDVETNDKN